MVCCHKQNVSNVHSNIRLKLKLCLSLTILSHINQVLHHNHICSIIMPKYFATIKRHFYIYACDKFMRIYQNGPLEILFMHSSAYAYLVILRKKLCYSYSMCSLSNYDWNLCFYTEVSYACTNVHQWKLFFMFMCNHAVSVMYWHCCTHGTNWL